MTENEVQKLAHWLPRLDSLELVLISEDHLACVCSLSLLTLLPAGELRLSTHLHTLELCTDPLDLEHERRLLRCQITHRVIICFIADYEAQQLQCLPSGAVVVYASGIDKGVWKWSSDTCGHSAECGCNPFLLMQDKYNAPSARQQPGTCSSYQAKRTTSAETQDASCHTHARSLHNPLQELFTGHDHALNSQDLAHHSDPAELPGIAICMPVCSSDTASAARWSPYPEAPERNMKPFFSVRASIGRGHPCGSGCQKGRSSDLRTACSSTATEAPSSRSRKLIDKAARPPAAWPGAAGSRWLPRHQCCATAGCPA